MTVPDRLYGLDGAVYMHDDPAGCYEADIDPLMDDDSPDTWTIQEWTVHKPGFGLPSADHILSWITERLSDCEEGWEYADYESLERHPDLIAAAEWFRTEITKRITWHMADKLIATHNITFNASGEPLYDGEPLYSKAEQS